MNERDMIISKYMIISVKPHKFDLKVSCAQGDRVTCQVMHTEVIQKWRIVHLYVKIRNLPVYYHFSYQFLHYIIVSNLLASDWKRFRTDTTSSKRKGGIQQEKERKDLRTMNKALRNMQVYLIIKHHLWSTLIIPTPRKRFL